MSTDNRLPHESVRGAGGYEFCRHCGRHAPTVLGGECPARLRARVDDVDELERERDSLRAQLAEAEVTLANERGVGEPPSEGWVFRIYSEGRMRNWRSPTGKVVYRDRMFIADPNGVDIGFGPQVCVEGWFHADAPNGVNAVGRSLPLAQPCAQPTPSSRPPGRSSP